MEWKTEILPFWIDDIRRDAAKKPQNAIVTIEGQDYTYPVTKTVVRDGFLKVYIEVEDEPVGNVTKALLVNANNVPLARGSGLIEKGDEGWQFSFKLFVTMKEAADDGTI